MEKAILIDRPIDGRVSIYRERWIDGWIHGSSDISIDPILTVYTDSQQTRTRVRVRVLAPVRSGIVGVRRSSIPFMTGFPFDASGFL